MFKDIGNSRQSLEISSEELLSRLPTADRENLLLVKQSFTDALYRKGLRGSLCVIGGIITKPPPRKDIDLAVEHEETPEVLERFKRLSPYKKAVEKFTRVSDIVDAIAQSHLEITIGERISPAIDEEFQSESILKHDGSIKISFPKGSPIEFVCGDLDKRKPYSLLAKV